MYLATDCARKLGHDYGYGYSFVSVMSVIAGNRQAGKLEVENFASARFSNGRSLLLVRPLLLRGLCALRGLWSRFTRWAGAIIVAGQALQCGGLPRCEFCFHLRHTF